MVDCTEKFVRNVRNAIQNAAINNVIDNDLSDLLIIDDPKPGSIYFLPKYTKSFHNHQVDLFVTLSIPLQ